MRIVLGLVYEEVFAAGAVSFTENFIEALRDRVDLRLVTVASPHSVVNDGLPLVSRSEWRGIPTLRIRPRTWVAYDLRPGAPASAEVDEGREIADEIARFARDEDADGFHFMEWEPLRGCLFEAAVRSGLPFLYTPFDYRALCPQIHLRERNERLCDGPDASGRKCRRCLDHIHAGSASWKRRLMTSTGLGTLLGPRYEPQWSLVERRRVLRDYLLRARRILPFSELWGDIISRQLDLPREVVETIPYGLLSEPPRQEVGARFDGPPRVGYLQRVSPESGAFFLLEAWRRAAVSPDRMRLKLFADPGGTAAIERGPYAELLGRGVEVEEGRIAHRMDEVTRDLAAVVVAYQFQVGVSAVGYEAVARGIPAIAPVWEHRGGACTEGLIDGVNAVKYRNWDVDSLASVFRRCAENPAVLRDLWVGCRLPREFGRAAFADAYVEQYRAMSRTREPVPAGVAG